MEDQIKCPKCGSTQLTANKKGFSAGKAVAGAVLTGGVGLLAGAIGSNKVYITCLKCGYKYKAGDYEKETRNFYMARKQSASSKDLGTGGVVAIFFLFSIIGGIFTYNLFKIEWKFLGVIFALGTILCIVVFISCLVEAIGGVENNLPKYET